MIQRPNILLVDLSNQLYRSAHTHAGLTWEGVFTGGLYGVLVSVCAAVLDVEATRLVFCLDSKPYIRSQEFPQYKQIRASTVDEDLLAAVAQSRKLVLELCKRLGLAVWGVPGFESDDLIGHTVRQHRHRYSLIVAQSNDSDLAQLFDCPGFRIYRGWDKDTKRGRVETADTFSLSKDVTLQTLGITPQEFPWVLAYAGTHNDVPGVHGIGPKKAAKALRDPTAWAAVQGQHGPMLARNHKLITLPHAQFPRGEPVPRSARVRRNDLLVYLARYGIQPTPQMTDALQLIGT